MPKIKPVLAWGYVKRGRLALWAVSDEDAANHSALDGERVVRVRISVVPNAKRKVKK